MIYVAELLAFVMYGLLLAVRLALLFSVTGYGLLPGWWLPRHG